MRPSISSVHLPTRRALKRLRLLVLVLLAASVLGTLHRYADALPNVLGHSSTDQGKSVSLMQLERLIARNVDPLLEETVRILEAHLTHMKKNLRSVDLMASISSSTDRTLVQVKQPSGNACERLRGQTIYLVGPHYTTYKLHNYLLKAFNNTRSRKPVCPGPIFCPFHVLCHPFPSKATKGRVRPADIVNTSSVLMRYIQSSSLHASSNKSDLAFNRPTLDPRTEVRLADDCWVTPVSTANVIVLNRGPLPAPAWSYVDPAFEDVGSVDSWGWLERLITAERASPISGSDLLESQLGQVLQFPATKRPGINRVLKAALHSSIAIFLPSVMSVLEDLRLHVGYTALLEKKVVFWHGSWFAMGKDLQNSTTLLDSRNVSPQALLANWLVSADEPWSMYHNAQVYMHDKLLPRILRLYNITYVPLSGAIGESNSTFDAGLQDYGALLVEGLVKYR